MKNIEFKCTSCKRLENIPINVVQYFDEMDGGDPLIPPRFECEKCGGSMEPVYYKSIHGYIYKLD